MYYLFLDDERNPWDVTWCDIPRDKQYNIQRNYDGFVASIIARGVPDFVSFDHDLADEHYVAMLAECEGKHVDYGPEKTGYDCAKFLVDFCANNGYNFPRYAVHSMNPIGSKRITDYIELAKVHLNI